MHMVRIDQKSECRHSELEGIDEANQGALAIRPVLSLPSRSSYAGADDDAEQQTAYWRKIPLRNARSKDCNQHDNAMPRFSRMAEGRIGEFAQRPVHLLSDGRQRAAGQPMPMRMSVMPMTAMIVPVTTGGKKRSSRPISGDTSTANSSCDDSAIDIEQGRNRWRPALARRRSWPSLRHQKQR